MCNILALLFIAPSAPIDISFTKIYETSVIVMWKKPINENGAITEYNLTYSFLKGISPFSQSVIIRATSTDENLEHKLTGMYAFVKYKVEISAKTVEYGNTISKDVITLEGSMYYRQIADAFFFRLCF